MVYSNKKAIMLRPQKEKGPSTFLIALAVAAAMFLPFIISEGGYFIFYGDFNVQQIPFYQMCHNAVRNGNFGWNTYTDLGVNFIGSYSFYLLGSPFFWLTIPFPNSFVPYLMGPLLILKFACAAFTAYLFIRRFTRTPEAARLGGILYAFSGFSVYNIFFNHFHEAIIVFPLLLLAIELFVTENRRGVFALAVCLAAVVNYFFFYGMVVFTLIYFFIRLFSKSFKITVGRFFVLAFEAVIGLLMSMVILLPTVICVLGVDRTGEFLIGWNAIMYGKEQIYLNIIECFFFPPDLPARPVFFPEANVRWSSLGGWLPLIGMSGVFAYCINKKGNSFKRIICTCLVFALFPILNSSFSFFNVSYYARWFYMPILIMVLVTVMALEDHEIEWNSALKWSGFITLAFVLVIGFFPQVGEEGKIIFGLYTQATDGTYRARFWISSAIALLSVLCTVLLIKNYRKRDRMFFNIAVCFVCIISVIYGIVFISGGKSHSYASETVIDAMIEGEIKLNGDKDRFRIDAYECMDNTGMFYGYQSINAFHSIVPGSVVDFYEYIGEERSVASRPTTDNYAIRNLLSVRYVLNLNGEEPFELSGKTKMPDYKLIDMQSSHSIYENTNYIPLGFCYDYYVDYAYSDSLTESLRANMMLKGVLLTDEQIERFSDRLIPLDTSNGLYYDYETAATDSKVLAQNSADSFAYTDYGFKATFNSDKDTLAFFSVPYDHGWTAFVNGKEVKIEKVNVGFMAIPISAGHSEIEFRYSTPGIYTGLTITCISTFIFIVYLIICAATKKKRQSEIDYPEGEALLDKWIEYDNDDYDNSSNDENTTLDEIADLLNTEYPVLQNNNEFIGGFKISADDEKNNDKNS